MKGDEMSFVDAYIFGTLTDALLAVSTPNDLPHLDDFDKFSKILRPMER
jgi:hypothetical protein